jgi:hypothetical protein
VDQNTKRLVWVLASLVGLGLIASACEISLPLTDCSWIHQPDMGGLVCLGANVLTIYGGIFAILLALLLGLGAAAVPH